MVIDTSALALGLFDEPERAEVIGKIVAAPVCATCAERYGSDNGSWRLYSTMTTPSAGTTLRLTRLRVFVQQVLQAGGARYVMVWNVPDIGKTPFGQASGNAAGISSITAPLERQFGQMPGLTRMTSTSSGG